MIYNEWICRNDTKIGSGSLRTLAYTITLLPTFQLIYVFLNQQYWILLMMVQKPM